MQKTQPKISVITVTYNCAALVERTMQNVLRQTYPNLEYIVIDGGSTDGTAGIIARYADRLAYTISEPDRGIYHAMNKGAHAATGDWLLFRNAGDYFFNDNAVADVFTWYKDKGEDVIVGGTRCFSQDAYYDKPATEPTGNVWKDANLSHPSAFIRRSAMLANPYPENLKIASDYYFFQKLLLNGGTYTVYPGFVSLFECEEGVSNSSLLLAWQERLQILRCLGAPDEEIRIARAKVYRLQISERIASWLGGFPLFTRLSRKRKFKGWTKQAAEITLKEV